MSEAGRMISDLPRMACRLRLSSLVGRGSITEQAVKVIRTIYIVVEDAFYTFLADDGWAIASHIALSTLMALFPFLIVLTSLAGFFGSKELADQAAGLMLQVWPRQVADSLSGEIHDVLTTTRTGVLTIGAALSVYFASNGVEALRVALNRAYAVVEMRRWYWLRLESIGYTLVAAFTALAMAFLIVLGPLFIEAARRHIPLFVESNESILTWLRYGITVGALVVALLILHAWLPAGRRGFLQILPGIVFTIVASLISGVVFGQYLARFANNYVTMYAGLASVIIALVFLYFIAAIFVFGGELNAAIIKSRLPHGVSLQAAQSLKPAGTQA
ncbi:membrane protein [Bradyrhizobium sp. GM24.11]